MKNLVYILLLSVAFTSCKPTKTVRDTERTVSDSTRTVIKYIKQIDTIRIAGDTVKIEIPIKDLSNKPIVKKSKDGRATAKISKVDDKVVVECLCAEEHKMIETQNTIITTLTKRLETLDTRETKTEFKTPWYSKILNGIGIIALLLVGLRFLRPF